MFESEEALRRLTALMAPDAYEHTTITFEEIVDLMRSEVVFAFDEGILNKFMARAMRNGLCLAADDRYVPNELDIHLTRIMLIQS